MAIPPKPTLFASNRAPDFVELKLGAYKTAAGATWWESRPVIKPRLVLVHTNGASREGSIESAINVGNAAPYQNTHPHYQVDRNRAAKLVPTDRKGIGNATTVAARGDHGNVSDWSLVIETADEGYPTPGEDGGFIGQQVEMVAQILAYESILWGIPLEYPKAWYSDGTAAHTDPFGYPYWSLYDGKVCPGRTKKQQLRDVVLPLARDIAAAWTAPESPPDEEDDVKPFLWRPSGYQNVFIICGADAMHASVKTCEQYGLDPKTPVVDDHPQTLKSVLAKAGLTVADLVK